MTPQKSGPVLYEVTDRVATITMNRPEYLNAMDVGPGSICEGLVNAVETANRDEDVHCIIVTGAGRAFSSGGHLGSLDVETAEDWYWLLQRVNADNERFRQLSKPVIGAINGMCYGSAFMMALHFDMLIAADTATLGLIETRIGSVGADLLTFHVGAQWAKFLALSGELISATKAKEIGLVMEVIPAKYFEEKIRDLARRIASMPRSAVMLNRQVVNGAMDLMGWKSQLHLSAALNSITNSVRESARAVDGKKFSDLFATDWKTYKQIRDAPYTPPWLDDAAEDSPNTDRR